MSTQKIRVPLWLALVCSGCAGLLVALQTRINGGLSLELENGVLAASVSFSIGFLLLNFWMLFSQKARTGVRDVFRAVSQKALPAWAVLGGLGGAAFVLTQSLVSPFTGLALFTVGIVLGQVVGGLWIDSAGFGGVQKRVPTPARIVGAGIAVLAVLFSVWSEVVIRQVSFTENLLLIFPVAAGCAVAVQSAMNGRVREVARSTFGATYLNFAVGASVLCVLALISLIGHGVPLEWPSEIWWFLGGPVGVVFIAISAALVKSAGVLLLSMSNVAGQLVAAVTVDALLPMHRELTIAVVLGAALALFSVWVAAFQKRHTRH